MQEHARSSELGQLLRLLDEVLRLSALAGAVDQARVELALGRNDRFAGFAQVRDVVQRVLEPEDVDPALRRARHEPAREISTDGTGADEEPSAERHSERRLGPRLERADPLPGALDSAAHRCVEDAAAGNLEVREADAVEQLGEPQEIRGRHPPCQRLLAEQPNSRVDERRHLERVTLPRLWRCTGLLLGRP